MVEGTTLRNTQHDKETAMHQHVEWDAQAVYLSVATTLIITALTRRIISARYQGAMVRVKVEAYREDDAVSIGEVAAIIDE